MSRGRCPHRCHSHRCLSRRDFVKGSTAFLAGSSLLAGCSSRVETFDITLAGSSDMIIDAHYHLDERIEPLDRLIDQMDRHGVDHVALIPSMNEPVEFKGIAAKAGALLPTLLMGIWRRLGLHFYNTSLTADGKLSLLGKTYQIYGLPNNEDVAQALLSHPDRFYGWIFVNPVLTDPIAELDKWAGKPGWIGVKSHPFWHRYPVSKLDDVGAYCEDRNLPLLVHLGGDRERGDYRFLPERHPRLKVIYAHAGVPFYKEVWDYVNEKDNIFIDLSNPLYVNDEVRMGAVKKVGAEKCVHGTDGPYLGADQGSMLKKIYQLPLSQSEKDRILGENLMDIINI